MKLCGSWPGKAAARRHHFTGAAAIPVDLVAVAIAALAFLAGGFVKGLVGIGLPMMALPILTLAYPVPVAVGLTIVPILVSNTWQAIGQGSFLPVIRRFWPLQLALLVTVLPASRLLVVLENDTLLVISGSALIISAVAMGVWKNISLPPRHEKLGGAVAGAVAGFLGGISSLFGVPIIIFLTSLALSRDEFVKSVSFIYLCAMVPYALSLAVQGVMGPREFMISTLCVLPVMAALTLAARLMRKADKNQFRIVLLVVLGAMGAGMVAQGIG